MSPRSGRVSTRTAGGQRIGWLDAADGDNAVGAIVLTGSTEAFAIGTHSTVLAHSAAGGVGRLLTQIAHHLGATVIGTASTAEKRRIAVDNGADHAID